MSGPQRQQLADVQTVTPALTDKAVIIQAGKVKTSLYSAIYNLFKTGYDSVYTTASAVTLQISNALIGYATETYANNAASAAAATKQDKFTFTTTVTGASPLTIDNVKGGVASFSDVIVKDNVAQLVVNSNQITATSKINYNLNYKGGGYPVVLFYKVSTGVLTFTVGNLNITGGVSLDTDDLIKIEYQIIA